MAGLPTVQVLLDDGTGAFPYDITAYARMTEGLRITAGRQDETSQVSPSSLNLTLDNTDGRFTLGSTIIAAPTPIKVNQRIRVRLTVGATTVNRFTGYVQEWPVTWPGGGDTFSTVSITATDALARLGRVTARAPLADAMIADGATLVWPLTDATPSITSGMVGPGAWPVGPNASAVGPLQILGATTAYPDPYPTFGATAMPNDNGSIAHWQPFQTVLGGPYNVYYLGTVAGGTTNTTTGPGVLSTTNHSIECAFRMDGDPTVADFRGRQFQLFELADSAALNHSLSLTMIDAAVQVTLAFGTFTPGVDLVQITAPGSVFDGAWHFVTASVSNGGKTVSLMLDGNLIGSATTTNAPTLTLGAALFARGVYCDGGGGYLAFYPTTQTLQQHQNHTNVAIGSSGFRSDAVISRYATLAGVPFTAIDSGTQNVPTFGGSDVASISAEVMVAEGGRLYVDGSGTLTFRSRANPLPSVYTGTPSIVATVDLLNPDARFSVDPQRVTNRAAVTRAGGSTVTAEDAASITQHGVYGTDVTAHVMDDSQAGNLAAYLVWLNAQPGPRLAGATFDLLTQTTAIQQAFLVDLMGAWLQITGLPSQAPTGTTADLYIEGWTEVIAATEWSLALNTSPKNATATTWWRLDDANFPLGTNTHPFY